LYEWVGGNSRQFDCIRIQLLCEFVGVRAPQSRRRPSGLGGSWIARRNACAGSLPQGQQAGCNEKRRQDDYAAARDAIRVLDRTGIERGASNESCAFGRWAHAYLPISPSVQRSEYRVLLFVATYRLCTHYNARHTPHSTTTFARPTDRCHSARNLCAHNIIQRYRSIPKCRPDRLLTTIAAERAVPANILF